MSLCFASLNSGSNGNCYLVGIKDNYVLIDAGISMRETLKRLSRLSVTIEEIKAIFISHEHADHISGLQRIATTFQIPVYLSRKMYENSPLEINAKLVQHIQHGAVIQIGKLEITAFSKKHDAADPFSFVISRNKKRVGVFTDIGEPCENLIRHFNSCHAMFLETNYDEELLENGNYPIFLKQRIKSEIGHLSNAQALNLFLHHKNENLSHLFFSHISRENNTTDRIHNLFLPHAGNVKLIIADRHRETNLFSFDN
jgi:phosphoribosyl 1,2-cyclic phosphodiesterase